MKTKKVVKRAPKGTVDVPATKKLGLTGVVVSRGGPVGIPRAGEITAVDPQALIAQAIARGLPDVSMERLFAMRKEMEAERAKKAYFVALAGFQHECPVVEKAKKVMNKPKGGDKEATVRYSYAPLEDVISTVQPFLERWGFSWTVKPSQADGNVKASCYAHHKDGHEELTEFSVPLDPDSYMSNPQRAAAALTFARRYAFINAFGIVTKGEDNDAQQDDEPRQSRREPIRAPQEKSADAPVPVEHEVKKEPEKLSDYDKILKMLKVTAVAPTKQVVSIFTENEQIDYQHEATEAKDKPEELKKIGADMVETWKKREKAIKGEK